MPTALHGLHLLIVALCFSVAAPAAADGEPEPGRYALVWNDARLHIAPDADAPWVRLGAWGRAERAEHPEDVSLVEVAGVHGEFLEVINLSSGTYPEGACHNSLDLPWSIHVHLYVDRMDVARATGREIEIRHPDGTGVTLEVGVAAVPLPSEGDAALYRVATRGYTADVELPPGTLVRRFDAGPHGEHGLGLGVLVAESSELRWGDGSQLVRTGHWADVNVYAREPHPRGALVSLGQGCASWRVAVREQELVPASHPDGLERDAENK